MVGRQMRLVIRAVARSRISCIAHGLHRTPVCADSFHEEQVILGVVFAAAGTAENQEGPVWSNFRIDIRAFTVAEGKWLRLLVLAVPELRGEQALLALLIDRHEINCSVQGYARLPDGVADINRV